MDFKFKNMDYAEDKAEEGISKYTGKVITNAELVDNAFVLTFHDWTKLSISDQGQSCCEHRWITSDDALSDIVTKVFKGIEEKDASTISVSDEDHEIMFVEIQTNDCSITLQTHNEHNGYYGGFCVVVEEL